MSFGRESRHKKPLGKGWVTVLKEQDSKEKTKLWTKDFVLISMVNLLLFASWQMFPFVFPVYLNQLGASDIVLGWITTITTIAALLIRPFCGLLLDRFGRKGVLLTGVFLMAVSVAVYPFFTLISVIFAIRFLHGLAWGVASTASQTVASDVIPSRRFAEGMGMFALSASLALAIAPGLALELFNNFGIVAVVLVALGALCLIFVLAFSMKYQKQEKPQSFHRAGIFERKSLLPATIVFFLTMCYGGLTTFLALHASSQGVDGIGVFFTAYAIAVALTRPVLGKVVDQKGYGVIIIPGLIAMVASLVLLSFADTLVLFVLVAVLYGFGFAACNSTLQAMAVAGVPYGRRGAANATYLVGFDSGIGVGALLAGMIASLVGYSGLYLSFALLPVVAGILFFLFARNRKPPALQQEVQLDEEAQK